MSYLIYKQIEAARFNELKTKIDLLESSITPLMNSHGFYLNKDSYYRDFLGLDYVYNDGDIMGNIGFQYEDKQGEKKDQESFIYYILKAYDTKTKRYYKKIFLSESFFIDEIEQGAKELFKKCFMQFKGLNKNNLTDEVTLLH